jgi:hypothetical protein
VKATLLIVLTVLIALTGKAEKHLWHSDTSSCCSDDGRLTVQNMAGATPTLAKPLHDGLSRRKARHLDANGNGAMVTVQTVYGFNITVHPAYASKFQRFFALLRDHGYHVPANITKCCTPGGTHVPGSNHYIGAACDIQTGWNREPRFVYHISDIIREAGLYDGCSFHDCGHIEAVRGTHNRAPNLYASIEQFKTEQATANYRP